MKAVFLQLEILDNEVPAPGHPKLLLEHELGSILHTACFICKMHARANPKQHLGEKLEDTLHIHTTANIERHFCVLIDMVIRPFVGIYDVTNVYSSCYDTIDELCLDFHRGRNPNEFQRVQVYINRAPLVAYKSHPLIPRPDSRYPQYHLSPSRQVCPNPSAF